jgi:hypothetical protein
VLCALHLDELVAVYEDVNWEERVVESREKKRRWKLQSLGHQCITGKVGKERQANTEQAEDFVTSRDWVDKKCATW